MSRPTAAVARHALLYGMGSVVGGITRALLLPVIARTLETRQYGVLSLLLAVTNFLYLIFELGLVAALVRFHHAAESPAERRGLRSLVLLGAPALDLLIAAPFLLARGLVSRVLFGTPDHGALVGVAIVAAYFGAQFQLLLSHFRADDRSREFALLMAARGVISLGVTFWLVFRANLGVTGFLVGNVVGPLAVVVVGTPWLLFRSGIDLRDARARLRTLLAFGLPLVPSGLGLWALTYLDAWLLRVFADLDAVGVYGYASELCMPIAVLVTSVQLAWPPYAFGRAKHAEGPAELARVFRHLFVVVTGGALAVSLLRREILTVLGAARFEGAVPVLPLLAAGTAIYAASRAFETGLQVAAQTKRLPVLVLITTLFNAALNAALIPTMRAVGAGLAIVLTNLLLAGIVLRESNRHFRIPFEISRLLRVLLLAAALVVAGDALPGGSFAGPLAVRVALLAAFPFLLVPIGAITWRELRALPAVLRVPLRRGASA